MGLIGEMHLLADVLTPRLGAVAAVAAWTGPEGAPKDFEVGRVCVEAKAFGASGPARIRITSEHQLDVKEGFTLFLHALPVLTGHPPGSGGRTLHEWVQATRIGLGAQDPSVSSSLDEKIRLAGYDAEHRYEETFSAAAGNLFRVGQGFPKIIPSMLPQGPSRVSYDIDLAACAGWRVELAELHTALEAPR